MLNRSRKKQPLDENQLAKRIVDQIIEETENEPIQKKNPHAVALGRKGGLKGGKARAEALTAERRREIALKASQARWNKDT